MTDHSQLVKPLVWNDPYKALDGTARQISHATVGFKYLASGEYWFLSGLSDYHHAPSLSDAKAAAQADYTARILSALNLDAIDALQARVEALEALARRISNEGRITSGGIRRPAKYIQIPAEVFSLARALLERKA